MGDTELTREREDIDTERIEELVELERDLAETRRRAKEVNEDGEDTESISVPQVTDPRIPVTGTVTDVRREEQYHGDKALVTVRVGGDEHVFEFDWPHPDDFDDNDLVRLLRGKGIDPERLADLRGRSITVLPTGDGEYELRVPQANAAARSVYWAAAKAGRYRILSLQEKDLAMERKLRPAPLGCVVLPAVSTVVGSGLYITNIPATTAIESVGAFTGFALAGLGGLILGLEIIAVALVLIFVTMLKLHERFWPF